MALWLPLEPSLFALPFERLDLPAAWIHALALPDVGASLLPGLTLPIEKLTGILLALYLFLIRDPLPRVGFDVRFGLRDVGYAAAGLALFGVVGIPLSTTARPVSLNPTGRTCSWPPWRAWLMVGCGGRLGK